MEVVFFQRKPFPQGNFSVEILSQEIKSNLPKDIVVRTHIARYHSKGIFKRLYSSIEATFHQGDVNHVTGDVNFLSMFLNPRKTVLTVLDVAAVSHSNPIAQKILHLFWLHIPVRRAGFVTAISNSTKKELLKIVNVNEDKIRVLHIPVSNLVMYTPKEFNTAEPVILHIGTGGNKNLFRLIEAINGIECRLEIVGKLNKNQIDCLEENHISYSNSYNISDQEMKVKYENADLLAFVSTYEGFGMPIIEAQIVGRPVITANILSMPEVAGEGAHLVDPYNVEEIKNGILRIIKDEGYRNTLIAKGKENAVRFSAEKLSKDYADLYREVYSKRNYGRI